MSEKISMLLAIIAGLVVIVNIIVQVLKPFLEKVLHPNWLALIVSMVVTLGAGGAYSAVNSITITWYLVLGAIIVGFMVTYASMFGYDKLKQALGSVK